MGEEEGEERGGRGGEVTLTWKKCHPRPRLMAVSHQSLFFRVEATPSAYSVYSFIYLSPSSSSRSFSFCFCRFQIIIHHAWQKTSTFFFFFLERKTCTFHTRKAFRDFFFFLGFCCSFVLTEWFSQSCKLCCACLSFRCFFPFFFLFFNVVQSFLPLFWIIYHFFCSASSL